MMGYYNDCYSLWPGHLVSVFVQILIVVLIVSVILRIIRGRRRDGRFSWPGSGAEALLKERFAKGEIDKAEYEEKLKVLRQ